VGVECREQPAVVPRLLDEITSATAHRLDRAVDAGPGGHHHDRGRRVERLEARQQVEAFGAGGGVPRVVHVDQQGVEVALVERGKDGAGRGGGVHLVALALEKEFEGLEDVLLVVSDEDAGGCRRHGLKVSGVGGQGPGPALTRQL